jgi:hypothetical protein
MLASLSASTSRRLNPTAELSFNPVDIKNRLTGVSVYTVANNDNSEFVLISGGGESPEESRQLGLFFFKESDAAAMVAKIKEQSPELAKRSHVMKVSLDKVYDFALDPQASKVADGVIFRFMPDAQQVQHALSLYRAAEVDANAFTGVPVFQAEGLVVKTEKAKYTPLFFSKDDLDAAVGNAYTEREQHREATTKAHSNRAKADLDTAQKKFDAAESEGKEQAKSELDKARVRSEMYQGRVDEQAAEKKLAPKVEVGCLEEVIMKMQEAKGEGEWAHVMFVPAGAISSQQNSNPKK